jgi:DNA-binding transcriptional regulator YiaG
MNEYRVNAIVGGRRMTARVHAGTRVVAMRRALELMEGDAHVELLKIVEVYPLAFGAREAYFEELALHTGAHAVTAGLKTIPAQEALLLKAKQKTNRQRAQQWAVHQAITPEQFRAARVRSGLTQVEFGRALGFSGKDKSVKDMVYQMENGLRNITERVAAAVRDTEKGAT